MTDQQKQRLRNVGEWMIEIIMSGAAGAGLVLLLAYLAIRSPGFWESYLQRLASGL